MNTLAPNIFVHDMNATLSFYQQLGFTLTTRVPEEGDLVWAMLDYNGVTFMLQSFESLGEDLPQISRQPGGSLLFYISIQHIEAYFEKVQSFATVLKGLDKTFYGATEFSILDNNGYVLTFAEHHRTETGGAA